MLDDIKKTFWATADKLRANMDTAKYKHLVLGRIVVKYISDTFAARRAEPMARLSSPADPYYYGEAAPEDIEAELEDRDYYTEIIGGAGHFWFHQFIAAPFQRLLEKHTIQGVTFNRIALRAFPSYWVLNPLDALKAVFDERVAPLWAKIQENYVQAQTLATLLLRLILGQLRLSEAEVLLEEACA